MIQKMSESSSKLVEERRGKLFVKTDTCLWGKLFCESLCLLMSGVGLMPEVTVAQSGLFCYLSQCLGSDFSYQQRLQIHRLI